jgi:hypothetical protein
MSTPNSLCNNEREASMSWSTVISFASSMLIGDLMPSVRLSVALNNFVDAGRVSWPKESESTTSIQDGLISGR